MEFQILSVILVFSGLIIVLLGALAWRYRAEPLPRSFLWLMVCTTIYIIGYAMEVSSTTLGNMLAWSHVQYVGIPFITAFYILVAVFYTGRQNWLKWPVYLYLFGIPTVTMILHFTMAYHNLLYMNPRIDSTGPFPIMLFDRGPWYIVQIIYANINAFAGNVLYVLFLIHAAPVYRKQAALMIAGSLIPWVGYIVYLSRILPFSIDIIPFAFVFTGCFYSFSVFKYRFFDVSPIARDRVFESMRDGIIVLDMENRLVDFNPTAAVIFPQIQRTMLGTDISEALREQEGLLSLLYGMYGDDESVDIEIRREGKTAYYRARIDRLTLGSGHAAGVLIVLYDETEHTDLLARLQELATTDTLTQIFNRRHFYDMATREVLASARHGSPFALILFDLDHFKRINDMYGHIIGDRALIHVADIARQAVREIDIFGRYGGEEFIIALPQTTPEMAGEIAERIRLTLEETPLRDGTCVETITASFGVSGSATGDAIDLAKYAEAADAAMYAAKTAGRNRVICRPVTCIVDGE